MTISRAQTAKQVKNAPASKKVKKVMGEFKKGTLKSGGSGEKVTNKKQAVAIALSEAGLSKPKKASAGGRMPKAKCRNGIAIRGKTRGVVV